MHARPTSRRESPDAPPSTEGPVEAPAVPAAPETDRQLAGTFRLELPAERWTWSDEVYLMHGFDPGDVVPSTDLIVSHKHPEDSAHLVGLLREAAAGPTPFSCVYRMLDARGSNRVLGIVGSGRRDGGTDEDGGTTTTLEGYFVDLTDSYREAVQREATASILASSLSRSTIEQAKGIVMAALGVSGDEAFAVLRRFSNDSNTPLREVADHLVSGFLTTPSVPLLDDVRKHLARVDPRRELATPEGDLDV